MDKRIKWIDYSKAGLIYLVVLAHYGHINTNVENLICAFHMPAFFFISGYLHKSSDWAASIKKNFQRLIIPALCFSFIYMMVNCAVYYVQNHALSLEDNLIKPLLGIVRYDRPNATPPCGVIWFLEVLFICNVLIDFIRKNITAIITIMLLCMTATWILARQGVVCMSYGFMPQRFLASFPFVAAGILFRHYDLLEKFLKNYILGIVAIVLFISAALWNGRAGIMTWRFGNDALLFFTIALIGSLAFFWLMDKIKFDTPYIILKISTGTITILCLHKLMIPVISRILHINPYFGSLIILAICFPLILLFDKYTPWLVGRKRA